MENSTAHPVGESKLGSVQRGEVWWAQIDARCPVVILSRGDAHRLRAMLVVEAAGAEGRELIARGDLVEMRVGSGEGLPRQGVLRVARARPGHINCNWLVTLSHSHLIERAGRLSSAKLLQLEDLLRLGGLE